jgi:putative methionine-R-sulfoxide reductase with GAF domain
VVPVFKCEGSQDVVAVLDIDSDEMSRFDEVDKKYLELVVSYLYK